MRRVDELAVHASSERCFTQSRADVSGNFVNRYGLFKTALTAIRQSHDRHGKFRGLRDREWAANDTRACRVVQGRFRQAISRLGKKYSRGASNHGAEMDDNKRTLPDSLQVL